MRLRSPRRGGGFTVIELSIGLTVLVLMVGGLVTALSVLGRGSVLESLESELQAQGERAVQAILADLKRSGFVTQGGNAFPHLFLDGNAVGAFAPHAHAPAAQHGEAGDADFGSSREIVFLQPRDADLDGRPDIGLDGALIWGNTQFSYVLVTRADGVNVLERRTDGANPRKLAHHVERITFDDNATSGFQVPLRAIRVRIWLRQRDGAGTVHRFFTESVVRLPNA